jgi:putative acyl-CoA dehydrogenase
MDDGARENARTRDFVAALARRLASRDRNDQSQARVLVRDLVLALQAALLRHHAPAAVADAFCASRLAGESGVFGTLPGGVAARAIVERAAPVR